jgi:hypothetical protein
MDETKNGITEQNEVISIMPPLSSKKPRKKKLISSKEETKTRKEQEEIVEETEKFECFLCIEEKPMDNMFHCNACKYKNCVDCHKIYLLTSTQDPHCMNCRAIIPYDIFLKKFGSKWIFDRYKKHRYNVLWDRQQAFIPQTVYKMAIKRKVDVLNKLLAIVRTVFIISIKPILS